MSFLISIFASQLANADARCIEVHKLFRVGIPSDIIYSFVIESSTDPAVLACLAPPMTDALNFQATNSSGAALPSGIQDALDQLKMGSNEMICGSFTCGEQAALIDAAPDMLRAYTYAAYHCINSADCDDSSYGYLTEGEDSYYGIEETYGGSSSTPTCQEFASTASGSAWLLLSGCSVIIWSMQDNCTSATECLEITYQICSSNRGYTLNAYYDENMLLRTDCNIVSDCDPPVPPCELDSGGEVMNAQTVTPTP